MSATTADAPTAAAADAPTTSTSTAATTTTTAPNKTPIVLVSGFLGDGGAWYWGDAFAGHTVLLVKVGPVSSLHDRACEMFYQLKGGRVDYGAAHAAEYGHERYGRVYDGLYPQWSAEKPLHLLGHSYGGCTVRYLQHLLATRFFAGHDDADASWVRSITTVFSPLRGSTTSYILGEREDLPSAVNNWSAGRLLTGFIHIYDWLDIALLKRWIDLGLDHWRGTKQHVGLSQLLSYVFGRSPISDSKDNAAYDMTVYAAAQRNKIMQDHPTTYYRSYVASMTAPTEIGGWHFPLAALEPLLKPTALLIGRYEYANPEHLCKGFHAPDWWENDGVVSTVSQLHPFECSESGKCTHFDVDPATGLAHQRGSAIPADPATADIRPGVWHTLHVPDTSHVSLFPFPSNRPFQQSLLKQFAQYIEFIDGTAHNPV